MFLEEPGKITPGDLPAEIVAEDNGSSVPDVVEDLIQDSSVALIHETGIRCEDGCRGSCGEESDCRSWVCCFSRVCFL